MIDRFAELLRELGVEYAEPLHPDKQGVCKLLINETMHVQIEYRPQQEALLLLTFLGETSPGKFRENLFKAALKANHLHPEEALLCYSEKNNQLALCQFVSAPSLNGKKLSEILVKLVKKAADWHLGLETGNLNPLLSSPNNPSTGKGLFGLSR